MPLALDPDATFDLVLATDQERPEESRPSFIFRFMANRHWKELAHVADHLDELGVQGIDAVLGRMEDVLKLGLVGWKNMVDPATRKVIPYDPQDFDRLVTPAEMSELMYSALARMGPSVGEKKASGSPSPNSSDRSARTATLPAPAEADQARLNRPSSSAPDATGSDVLSAGRKGVGN
jgi:hypothetical protein